MNQINTKQSHRDLAKLRKWFKQLLLEEWKNFEEKKYSSLPEKKELHKALRDEANKMLDECLTQEKKDRAGYERAKWIVGAKYAPNVLEENEIEKLANTIKETIGLYFFFGSGKEAEIKKLVKMYGHGILEYASDLYAQLIQKGAFDRIDEIEAFTIFYLKMREEVSNDSSLLSVKVKMKIMKISKALDFQKCVDFYLSLNKSIRDEIIDIKHLSLHACGRFLNLYLVHLGSPETEAPKPFGQKDVAKKKWTGTQTDFAVEYERERLNGNYKGYSRKRVFQFALEEYEIRDSKSKEIKDWRIISKALSNYKRCNPPIEEQD